MNGFREGRVSAQDGISLHYRDYGDRLSLRAPILCLTGLTRNAKDYHDFASRHGARRRVVCLDYRGRGRSAYDPNWKNYVPPTYVGDALAVLTALDIGHIVSVGTSLGGILTMGLGAARPGLLKAALLNDIGPVVDRDGLARIAGYVGTPVYVSGLAEGAERLKEQFVGAYPDLSDAQWMMRSEQTFIRQADGRYGLDYDVNLGNAVREAAAAPAADLWPLFGTLRNIPTLAIRGALSDVLSAEVFAKMQALHPKLIPVMVRNRGHVPLLDEPDCQPAIDRFLDEH